MQKVTKFTDSREWKQHSARAEQFADQLEEYGNPYFMPFSSPLRDTSTYAEKEIINFGSYNYLCMSGDPEVKEAAAAALEQYGAGCSGSRVLTGEKEIHQELERRIAKWKHTEDAVVLVSGHATNVTFIGNFCNENDLIIYDILNHNSITEGLRMTPAKTRRFAHNNYEMLEKYLKNHRDEFEKVLIVVEGVYSMDGDISPVDEYVRIKKEYGCMLMVDEAHSAGVIGKNGGGVDEYFNLKPDDIDIKMGTMSKTLGTCGGYLAGSKELVEYLRYSLPGFIFSVGISPVLAAATIKAIDIIERDNTRVASLQDNVRYFIEKAQSLGLDTCLAKESPIVPVLIGSDELAFGMSMRLMMEDGIFVPPALYPAVPRDKARLRFCLTSNHSRDQIDKALNAVKKMLEEY